MSSEEALDGYNDYNHRYLYMGEISGNLIRPLCLISCLSKLSDVN